MLHFLCIAVAIATKFELLDYDPQADPAAVVNVGNARFTVLADRLIRIEYASGKNQCVRFALKRSNTTS
jgi:hypothetical protein